MAFIKRINYLGSFTTLFILTGLSFSFLIIFIIYVKFSDFKTDLDKEKAIYEYSFKKEKLEEFYQQYSNIVLSLQNNRFLTTYLKNPIKEKKENLSILFETIVEQEKYINQLRYIDENGDEILRVDRKKLKGKVVVVENKNLQNKKHRGYFINTMKNKPSELYISKLDLNMENLKIEYPYKPVLRLSIPVYYKLKKRGILIVNIFASKMLEDLVVSNNFEIDIFDQDGYMLFSNNSLKNSWTRYTKKETILDKNSFIVNDILVKNENKETLYIGFIPKGWIGSFYQFMDISIVFLFLFIICIAFILAYMLSRIPKRLFDELESQQNMLIQQSKVAAMGEMTSMLAHQWRQPLNTVSVLLQEIEIKRSMKLLDDKEFNNLTTKIKSSLTHMSSTIDDFRDFFKVEKQKTTFNVQEVIKSVYNILEVKFKKNDIKYNVEVSMKLDKESLEIDSYEGVFKQVIINILNNAIEALDESKREDKKITIKILHLDGKLCISIEDNAGGIKDSMINRLFEPYSSTKLEQNGSGLGLYMSKMLLEKDLKGYIEAENVNGGARFSIYI